MRKQLSLLIAASALAMPATSMADVKVYGKAFLTYENTDTGSGSVSNLNSYASRLGVKGSDKLDNDMEVFYQLEYEVDLDGDYAAGEALKARGSFIGIRGNFGAVAAGIEDTPTKDLLPKLDLFNDMGGDYKHVMEGETRAKNMVWYESKEFNGFTFTFAPIMNETDANGDATDSLSMSVKYKNEGLTVGLAQDVNVKSGSFKKDYLDITRVAAQYKVGSLTVGGIYQQATDGKSFSGDQYDRDSFHVSAAYKLDKVWTVEAQYTAGDDNLSTEKTDMSSLGLEYKFGKNTKGMIFYTGLEKKVDGAVSKEYDSFGVGIEHKF